MMMMMTLTKKSQFSMRKKGQIIYSWISQIWHWHASQCQVPATIVDNNDNPDCQAPATIVIYDDDTQLCKIKI